MRIFQQRRLIVCMSHLLPEPKNRVLYRTRSLSRNPNYKSRRLAFEFCLLFQSIICGTFTRWNPQELKHQISSQLRPGIWVFVFVLRKRRPGLRSLVFVFEGLRFRNTRLRSAFYTDRIGNQQSHGIESAMQEGMRQPTSAIQAWLIFALAPPSWIFLTHCFAKNSFVWHIWQMQWNHHDHHHHLPLYITKIKNTAGC